MFLQTLIVFAFLLQATFSWTVTDLFCSTGGAGVSPVVFPATVLSVYMARLPEPFLFFRFLFNEKSMV